MPDRIPRPCRAPGCPRVTSDSSGHCEQHRHRKPARSPDRRASPSKRGYTYQWTKARKLFLRDHPFCVDCLKRQHYRTATVVDHIKPHRQDSGLFWDTDNWQPLCKTCHDRKTGRGE